MHFLNSMHTFVVVTLFLSWHINYVVLILYYMKRRHVSYLRICNANGDICEICGGEENKDPLMK
jgi:hypothetical protein